MIKKIRNSKFVIRNLQKGLPAQAGMTIMELIVVLAIFAVLSVVVIFNYNTFQSKVDITNLANDIALQVVGAQRFALAGLLPTQSYPTGWKPAYGVFFSTTATLGADNKDFISFVDLNNNNLFDTSPSELLSTYTITKNDYISNINVYCPSPAGSCVAGSIQNLTVTFTRPNSVATFYNSVLGFLPTNVSYVEITVSDSAGKTPSTIDLYPSGRVQIN